MTDCALLPCVRRKHASSQLLLSLLCVLQGVLLYGPPGTGKTLLARAVAHHTDCTFIRVSGSELVQKYIGEGSRMVRELFVMARWGRRVVAGVGLWPHESVRLSWLAQRRSDELQWYNIDSVHAVTAVQQ